MSDITDIVDEDTAKKILDYAKEHYEEGWDFIYECYTIQEIIEITGSAGSGYSCYKEALSEVADFVSIYNDARSDIQGA